jgi:cupin fold WbuC family metalloprotein
MSITIIDISLLEQTAQAALNSPRLRKNHNFHSNNEDACHRLLNALQPGTYVQPHCHFDSSKEETIVVLAGRFGVIIFDEYGNVKQHFEISATGPQRGVNIPCGVFHSMLALESNSVFFEAKAGPYMPLIELEKATWAPTEGELGVAAYLATLYALFDVDKETI